ncbi:MAG: hypothetical protein ACYC7A_14205 [Thermoanaerobaculia bacterium]
MIRWLIALGVSATLALSASAQTRVTVQPKGTIHLDDIIEVTIDIDHDYCQEFTPPVDGFEVESKRIDSNSFRFYLAPQAIGRATFGPVDVQPVYDKSFHIDAIGFDIAPPIDDGEAPVEEILKRQMRSGRYPFVVRARGTERQPVAGRAFLLELVAYTVGRVAVLKVDAPDLGVRMMEVLTRDIVDEIAVAGTPVQLENIARWAVAPEDLTWSRSEPGWVKANVFPSDSNEPVHVRRRVPAIVLETVMPAFAVKHPVGTFRMTCPTMFWKGNGKADGEVEIRGTGTFANGKLEIEGSPAQPLFVFPIEWGTKAQASEHEAYLEAKVPIRVTSVAAGERKALLPALVFRYHDAWTGEVMSARCAAENATLHGAPEPPPAPVAVEATAIPSPAGGADAGTAMLVVQGIALLLAIVFGTFAYRAATR